MTIISLFSGAGGLDLGLIQAGNDVIWANDIDADAVATYKANINDHIIQADIQNIDITKVPSADVVVGGFPCQGFSMANIKRNIDDERNVLYKFFYNAIKEKQPKFFIAENVKGILSLGKGSIVNQIKTDFEDAGYIVEVHKVNMADYGVPQHRERVLFIGQRKDLGTNMIFSFPNPTNSKEGKDGLPRWKSIKEAIDDLPPIGNTDKDPNNYGSAYRFVARNFTAHRVTDPAKPSPTILARGNGKGGVCAIPHYNGKRRLSIRESAVVQTFPRNFVFMGKMGACYRQIGNAVPVHFAKLFVVREDKKNDTDTATVYLTLHDQNGLPVLHHTCRLNTSNTLKVDTIIVTDTTLIKRLNTGKVTATFAVSNELSKSTHAKVSLLRDSLSYQSATSTVVTAEQRVLVDTLEACVFSGYNSVDYGRLYRGWGQFAYNGNKAYATQPIEVSALTIDRDKYKDTAEHYKSTHDGNQLAKSLTPVNEQRFFVMGYDANKRMYVGGSEHVFISLDTICSSRIGEDAIIIDSVHYTKNAGELSAPVLMSESKSNGYGVSGGISYAGLSGSKSTQTSYSKVALMDINGNGYPDWLEEVDGSIVTQYTKATGTLGEDRMKLNVSRPRFKASSSTVGANGSLSKQASAKNALAISINPKPQDDETPGGSDTKNSSNGNAISSVSVSASGNFTSGTSHTESDWTDLNGNPKAERRKLRTFAVPNGCNMNKTKHKRGFDLLYKGTKNI